MSKAQHLSIEERLEHIEQGIQEIKGFLKTLTVPKVAQVVSTADEVMNVKELSKFAKVEASVVYAACAKREIKFFKTGKHYKFKKEDILTWMDSSRSQKSLDVDNYVNRYLEKHKMKG